MEACEAALEAAGFEVISPRRSGKILVDMAPEERRREAAGIFARNVADMKACHRMLAVIDDRDAGTMMEVGYVYGLGKPIYTFTNFGFGVNVMLQGCVLGHAKGIEELREMLIHVKRGESTARFSCDASQAY
jgi:nucleoside 2-deoxyribosyltransferase